MYATLLLSAVVGLGGSVHAAPQAPLPTPNALRIQPWPDNPRYWQYQGEPVLLIGGSKDDNLFQIPDLQEHLDLLAAVGGNVIRNTMSDRQDFGFEVYPFAKLPDGKYDLERWNDEYWRRFSDMLRLTYERDIIVQIEVWDRFDYSRDNWKVHPYNPANNVNYSVEQCGLATSYANHPGSDEQPFFHTIPGMPRYEPRLDVVRATQERFVDKLLSVSLDYGNVLYCMDNETSSPMQWGQHWMSFIRQRAGHRRLLVYCTDMFDNVHMPERSRELAEQIRQPELYPFLDVSQVNSRNFGQDHWDRFQWIVGQVQSSPRPLNHTKIYSAGESAWGSGTPKEGVQRFWRNIVGGAASSRFHRPTSGIGLNELSQACLRAARKVESVVKFWDVVPHQELLAEREPNEAYLAARPGEAYILFFTDGGRVTLDLTGHQGVLAGRWVDINAGDWGAELTLRAGAQVEVGAPGEGPHVLVAVSLPGGGERE